MRAIKPDFYGFICVEDKLASGEDILELAVAIYQNPIRGIVSEFLFDIDPRDDLESNEAFDRLTSIVESDFSGDWSMFHRVVSAGLDIPIVLYVELARIEHNALDWLKLRTNYGSNSFCYDYALVHSNAKTGKTIIVALGRIGT